MIPAPDIHSIPPVSPDSWRRASIPGHAMYPRCAIWVKDAEGVAIIMQRSSLDENRIFFEVQTAKARAPSPMDCDDLLNEFFPGILGQWQVVRNGTGNGTILAWDGEKWRASMVVAAERLRILEMKPQAPGGRRHRFGRAA